MINAILAQVSVPEGAVMQPSPLAFSRQGTYERARDY